MRRRLSSIASYSSVATSSLRSESPVPLLAEDDDLQSAFFPPVPGQPYVETSYWQMFEKDYMVYNYLDEARDHMANERTVLAWLRIAATFTSFGILACQFSIMNDNTIPDTPLSYNLHQIFHKYDLPICFLSMILGIFVISVSIIRYFHVHFLLVNYYIAVTRITLFSLLFATSVLLVIILVLHIEISLV